MSKKIEILFLPAENGDSILIKLGDPIDTSILIDGGTSNTYPYLHKELSELYKICPKNYIFLTHCDDDHIGGLIHEPKKKKNKGGNKTPDQLKTFTELLEKSGVEVVSSVYCDYKFPEDNNFKITILSPRKKTLDKFNSWIEPRLGLLSRASDWNVPISKLVGYKDKKDLSPTRIQ